MPFQYLLFDADNTLLDFSKASKLSLWQTFTDFGSRCTPEIYQVYKQCNARIWAAFERQEITADRLRTQRFEDLFNALSIAPSTATAFSKQYLDNLVLLSETYDGVEQLLKELGRHYKLGLITNGLKEVQRPRLSRLQLSGYFDSIVVSDEIGVAKPDIAFFEHTFNTLDTTPPKAKTLVIGDNLHSDIKGGNAFGVATCWISHGHDNATDILPDYTIEQVKQLPDLLDGLSKKL